MAAEPRIYKYTDTGAPAPTSRYDALYEILKACLVDGYGSQPAAGWSMVYDNWSTDGMATFTNAAQSGVLGLVAHTSGIYGCTLFIADVMVDATHAVTARSGQSQVTDLPALANQTSYLSTSIYSTNFSKWVVIANENFVIVLFAQSDTYLYSSPTNVFWSYLDVIAAGSMRSLRGMGGISDAAVGNFVLMARNGSSNLYPWTGTGYGACLTDETGSSVSGDYYASLWPYEDNHLPSLGRNVVDGLVEMRFQPVEIFAGSSSGATTMYQLGRWPMLLASWQLSSSNGRYYSDKLSTAPLTELIDVGGKNCYVIVLNENRRALLSMALEDWI